MYELVWQVNNSDIVVRKCFDNKLNMICEFLRLFKNNIKHLQYLKAFKENEEITSEIYKFLELDFMGEF